MWIIDQIRTKKKKKSNTPPNVLSNTSPTDNDTFLINRYTKHKLTKNDVYVFSFVLCDNDVDKDFERFTTKSLFELQKLYIGKTGIIHDALTARIFDCKIESVKGKKTATGDDYFRLRAKAFVVKDKDNKNLETIFNNITNKEISIGCAVKNRLCSICGNDIDSYSCTHTKGKKYKRKLCCCKLVDVVDAYEFAVVADTVNKKDK